MAAIIKAGRLQHGANTARCVAFNLADMSDNASEYLVSVKRQAAQIVTKAQQEAKAIREEAERAGRQAAVEAAEQEARAVVEAKWKTLSPALEQAIQSINQQRDTWVCEWERNVVQLVVAIAARVVRREIEKDPEIPLAWIRESLELAADSGAVQLHLNPQDYDSLGVQRDAIANDFNHLAPTDIIADPDISLGGCRVVTEHGHVDHQLESQLDRIKEEFNA